MVKEKKFVKSAVSFLLVCVFCITLSVSVFAESTVATDVEYPDPAEWIIGSADEQPQTRGLSNVVALDWDATATKVIIYITNLGLDTLDLVAGTVQVNGTIKNFSATNIPYLTKVTVTVDINMHLCYEEIVVNYYAADDLTNFGEASLTGHREMPSSLSLQWVAGGKPTIYDSINDHYSRHRDEVGSTNIVDYAEKAARYRAQVMNDIETLSDAALNARYKITVSDGYTVAHKYKHIVNRQYAILSDAGYFLVSYGI